MKIALIRRRYSAVGGAELYADRLMRALVANEHQVVLLAESWPDAPGGVEVRAIPCSGTRSTVPGRFADGAAAVVQQERFDCVFSLERTWRQDVYRAGDGVHRAWLERRRTAAPLWKRPFIGRGSFHRNVMQLEAATFDPANTRHIIVNSNMVRAEIQRHFSFPLERIHLVRNGIELNRFRGVSSNVARSETRRRFGVRDEEFLVLFVGSGWERKGLHHLLAAMARLEGEPMRLLVAGKGRPPRVVPTNVRFTGPMARIEEAFSAADLFVFLPVYEPSANVCFEALAANLPVVTTAVNGAAEILEPGLTGEIVADPADAAEVAATIRRWKARRDAVTGKGIAGGAGGGAFGRLGGLDLSIERNTTETLKILELAAAEKA